VGCGDGANSVTTEGIKDREVVRTGDSPRDVNSMGSQSGNNDLATRNIHQVVRHVIPVVKATCY
jgi:hypothetical protein